MTLSSLTKLYDQLTPRERVPLLFAATTRGDEAELQRLLESSGRETFSVAKHARFARAFMDAADFHMLNLLDLAANHWLWWGMWMIEGLPRDNRKGAKKCRQRVSKAERQKELRTYGIMCYYATRFVAFVDGWKRFCQESNIDPEFHLKMMPGWDTVVRAENHARDHVFTPEQAVGFLCSETVFGKGPDEPDRRPEPIETVEQIAQAWHKLVNEKSEMLSG